MSTSTVSVRQTAEEIHIQELREREAQAREAARQQLRLNQANQAVMHFEQRFQVIVGRLDTAAQSLPDLHLNPPAWPTLTSQQATNPAQVEVYAGQVRATVEQFERDLNTAIATAERALARRKALAQAWLEIADTERRIQLEHQQWATISEAMHEPTPPMVLPQRPHTEATLETVQTFLQRLHAQLAEVTHQHHRTQTRIQTFRLGQGLVGHAVTARSNAQQALQKHTTQIETRAREQFQTTLQRALRSHNLDLDDLPPGTRRQIEGLAERADSSQIYLEQMQRWVAREATRREHIAKAWAMMQKPPVFSGHARRWEILLNQLQRVSAGLEPWTNSLDFEYEQIRLDAQVHLNEAYSKADFIAEIRRTGFEVYESDGNDLVAVNLEHPEVWLQIHPQKYENGFGATIEMFTTAAQNNLVSEPTIINSICSGLEKVVNHPASQKIEGASEVLERTSKIKRKSRPPVKAMHQSH